MSSKESGPNIDSTDKNEDRDSFLPTLDRFNAFSDGVFAIAITLLVLELPVPPEGEAVWGSLKGDWHEFLGYLISFAFIGSIWLTHSELTKVMKRGDRVVFGLNLILLLFVALLPFSTSLMVTHLHGTDVLAGVLVYGTNVLLSSITLSLMIYYVSKDPELVNEDVEEDRLRGFFQRRWIFIGVNVLALAVAFVAPLVSIGLYLVMTAMMLVLPFLGLHRHLRRT